MAVNANRQDVDTAPGSRAFRDNGLVLFRILGLALFALIISVSHSYAQTASSIAGQAGSVANSLGASSGTSRAVGVGGDVISGLLSGVSGSAVAQHGSMTYEQKRAIRNANRYLNGQVRREMRGEGSAAGFLTDVGLVLANEAISTALTNFMGAGGGTDYSSVYLNNYLRAQARLTSGAVRDVERQQAFANREARTTTREARTTTREGRTTSAQRGGSCGSANTLGGAICNLVASFKTVPGLLTGFSYLAGLILGFMGIWKLKEHALDPRQTPIFDPLKRFAAGGMFFALPYVAKAVSNSIEGRGGNFSMTGFAGRTSGGGLDAILVGMMADIWTPTMFLFAGFCYLAGIILVMVGVSRLLKTEQEGPRGPTGIGTIMTFVTAGVLLSIDSILGAVSTSMFGNSVIETTAQLRYPVGGDVQHVQAVISAVIAFVAIVGWISFIRGWFIVRQAAEGNGQASMMAAVTHILGGALAINLGPLMNAVQNTFGVAAYGVIFS